MSERVSKILNFVLTAVIVVGFSFGIWFVVKNWSKLTSGANLYTQSEVDEEKQSSYEDGVETGERYRVLCEEYLAQIQVLESDANIIELNIAELNREISELENTLDENELAYNTQLGILQSSVVSLTQSLNSYRNQIDSLNSLISQYSAIANETHTFTFNEYKNSSVKVLRNDSKILLVDIPTSSSDFVIENWVDVDSPGYFQSNPTLISNNDLIDILTIYDKIFKPWGKQRLYFYSISSADYANRDLSNAILLTSAWFNSSTILYSIFENSLYCSVGPYLGMSTNVFAGNFESLTTYINHSVGWLPSNCIYFVDNAECSTSKSYTTSITSDESPYGYAWGTSFEPIIGLDTYYNSLSGYNNVNQFTFESIELVCGGLTYSIDFSDFTSQISYGYQNPISGFDYWPTEWIFNGQATSSGHIANFDILVSIRPSSYEFDISINNSNSSTITSVVVNNASVKFNFGGLFSIRNNIQI